MYRKLSITRFFWQLVIFGIYFCCRLIKIFLTQFWTAKLLIHKPQLCHRKIHLYFTQYLPLAQSAIHWMSSIILEIFLKHLIFIEIIWKLLQSPVPGGGSRKHPLYSGFQGKKGQAETTIQGVVSHSVYLNSHA